MGPRMVGQGWALGMDGPPYALGMDAPWALMAPNGTPDKWAVEGDGTFAWMGLHGFLLWIVRGQECALGMDGLFLTLELGVPRAGMVPLYGWALGINGVPWDLEKEGLRAGMGPG